ncbi:MAG: exodeoxyribonuclease VII small subunit [Drouetiella hepatica Uher 2000/2452]|jgi:exodeoxyribonuclease VII small subunit|uniref:Exodeoxyribonuclease 7 small subunit n=1 Tax=Drouetiella hepatica Uher 2000/2452 TaxID=904376 RepID=A0A951QFV8_9CYAN|nr:exodeoxyribonuclease VII small subunit [Drouetiella hepatica Uher 2000/2452]
MNDSSDLSKLSISPPTALENVNTLEPNLALDTNLEGTKLKGKKSKSGKAAPEKTDLLPNWSYEKTVAEIETIISRIELGELELADVFDQFSAAMEQLRQCEAFLMQQQQQVDLLIETLVDEPEGF